MGEFLSVANKNKISEDDVGKNVNIHNLIIFYIIHNSYVTVQVECKDGEKEWKTLTYQI
jgi:hypothetical protein